MIAKITHGSSLNAPLNYNQRKVEDGNAHVLVANKMIESLDGSYSLSKCMQSFNPYLIANQKTEKPALHISLNPDPKDMVTDQQFVAIAQEYLEKLGYGNQPYIVYRHEDIDRHHIHIVSIRVDEMGKMIPDNFERRRSMEICREIEEKYNLIKATPKLRYHTKTIRAVCYEDGNVKEQLKAVLENILNTFYFPSFKEYKSLLTFYNIHVEEVSGKTKENSIQGILYSATTPQGQKVGTPFPSASLGQAAGYKAIQDHIIESVSKKKTETLASRTKQLVPALLSCSKNENELKLNLAKHNIDVLFRKTESGRIYGVTFIDQQEKIVLNGSRLGKDFSANTFDAHFMHQSKPLVQSESNPTIDQIDSIPMDNKTKFDLMGLFEILPLENSVGSSGEDPYSRKQKRKKNRGNNLT